MDKRKYLDDSGLTSVAAIVFGFLRGTRIARTSRLTVGTSANGWTAKDCDYLCDGTADEAEINAAIAALPATGGEIVLLDGSYHITAPIDLNKVNTTLSGNGESTKLYQEAESGAIITATAAGCTVRGLNLQCQNKGNYNGYGVRVSGDGCTISSSTVEGAEFCAIYIQGDRSIVSENRVIGSAYGIYLASGENNTAIGNVCVNNDYGILVGADCATVSGNICRKNVNANIQVKSASCCVVSGNNAAVHEDDTIIPQYAIYINNYCDNVVVADNQLGAGSVYRDGNGRTNVVGYAPAIADQDHLGCYYRMVDAENSWQSPYLEWINPPMVPGTEYRTTKRFNGLPVYTAAVTGTSASGTNTVTLPVEIAEGHLLSVVGTVNNFPVPYSSNGNAYYTAAITKSIVFTCASSLANKPYRFVVEYTK